MPAFIPVEKRLLRLSKKHRSGCWLWIGSIDRCGYGKINSGRETLAHRLAYTQWVGPIPKRKEIDHICRVRNCINPKHLKAVTHRQNVFRGDYKSNHRNGRKTHCMRGHPLSGENLLIRKAYEKSVRQCRICDEWRAKRRARRAKHRSVKIVRNLC